MAESYLILWAQDRLKALKQRHELGKPLRVLYGSQHSSAPSLRRYGIQSGDRVFIVGLKAGTMSLVCRIRVGEVLTVMDYLRDHLLVSPAKLERGIGAIAESLADERPELGHQLPFGCVDEAALAAESTPIRLDLTVPAEVLAALAFRDARGRVRALPVEDGRLKKPMSIQGHFFRLTSEAAAALDSVL